MSNRDSPGCFISGDFMDSKNTSCGIRAAEFAVTDQEGMLQKIREIARRNETHIVCFDAEKLAGCRHAETAIRLAERSFFHGSPISNSFEMEALLYASGSRQCNAAVSFGLHEGANTAYVCCCPDKEAAWKDLGQIMHFTGDFPRDITPEKSSRLMELFGITAEELEAAGHDRIAELVLERVALLEVYK